MNQAFKLDGRWVQASEAVERAFDELERQLLTPIRKKRKRRRRR